MLYNSYRRKKWIIAIGQGVNTKCRKVQCELRFILNVIFTTMSVELNATICLQFDFL